MNDTPTPITVTLVLDATTQDVDNPEFVREQLREFTRGQGVTILAMNAATLTATYRVDSEGYMIVYEGMGTKPYFRVARMVISQGTEERSFAGGEELERVFEPSRGGSSSYRFELKISSLF